MGEEVGNFDGSLSPEKQTSAMSGLAMPTGTAAEGNRWAGTVALLKAKTSNFGAALEKPAAPKDSGLEALQSFEH